MCFLNYSLEPHFLKYLHNFLKYQFALPTGHLAKIGIISNIISGICKILSINGSATHKVNHAFFFPGDNNIVSVSIEK